MPSNEIQQSPRDSDNEPRPQAEPLPSKRGEIGFIDGVHNVVPEGNASVVNLPERHPADRDQPPAFTATPSDPPSPNVEPPAAATTSEEASRTASPAPNSISKSSSILKFLKPTKSFGGVRLATLLIFTSQLLLLGATAVTWFFSTRLINNTGSQNMPGGASSSVFVHVIFLLAVIGQLIFLERRFFRLRGERYSYLHPGEILPRHRGVPRGSDTGIAFAPWNRPPLPTYAAALAQSGVGTGDVEDHLIAAPPPPAYGNTRGSTLLLQGYLRNSLRAQRPPSVVSEAASERERPISYASRDERWEEIQDADRARQLDATLSRLQAPRPRSASGRTSQQGHRA